MCGKVSQEEEGVNTVCVNKQVTVGVTRVLATGGPWENLLSIPQSYPFGEARELGCLSTISQSIIGWRMLVDTLIPKHGLPPFELAELAHAHRFGVRSQQKTHERRVLRACGSHTTVIYHTSRMPGPQNYEIYQTSILELQHPGFLEASNLYN